MSEQLIIKQAPEKIERSQNYTNTRLSYDCLMASTKSFVNNFNLLTTEEKVEFKSLATYVKQLEKCMIVLKNSPVKPTQRNQKEKVLVPETEVIEELVLESVSKSKKGSKQKKVKEEISPTASSIAEVMAEDVIETKEPVKKGRKESARKVVNTKK